MLTDGNLMRLSKDNFLELLKKPLVHYVNYDQACAMIREGATWLDVRLGEEYANYSLNDSINLPLVEIRDQAAELFSNRTYIICCDTGRRSAAAAFLLSQRGFEVFVLENGLRWDIPLADLGMTEESHSATVSTEYGTDAALKPCVAVDASYDWPSEAEPVRETADKDAGTIRATLARLETEMANYTKKTAQAEAAANEARMARGVLQEQLQALASLVHRKFPEE